MSQDCQLTFALYYNLQKKATDKFGRVKLMVKTTIIIIKSLIIFCPFWKDRNTVHVHVRQVLCKKKKKKERKKK